MSKKPIISFPQTRKIGCDRTHVEQNKIDIERKKKVFDNPNLWSFETSDYAFSKIQIACLQRFVQRSNSWELHCKM
jgi:hypothetical protein